MFTDTQPNGELASQCVTASCLAHSRKVWTGGDAHEWRHQDNRPCAGQATTHSAGCLCWDCQGDPFAGIPQPDADPFAAAQADTARTIGELAPKYGVTVVAPNVVVVDPADLAGFLADVNRRELERGLAELRAGYQPDLFDVATTELVKPGMNGVLF